MGTTEIKSTDTNIIADMLIGCCEIEFGEDKPYISYHGKKVNEIVKWLREKIVWELLEGAVLIDSGKDFDGNDSIQVVYKGEIAIQMNKQLELLRLPKGKKKNKLTK